MTIIVWAIIAAVLLIGFGLGWFGRVSFDRPQRDERGRFKSKWRL
jgi:hypothetical protein